MATPPETVTIGARPHAVLSVFDDFRIGDIARLGDVSLTYKGDEDFELVEEAKPRRSLVSAHRLHGMGAQFLRPERYRQTFEVRASDPTPTVPQELQGKTFRVTFEEILR